MYYYYFFNTTVKTDPSPTALSQEIWPLSSSQIRLTIASPSPVEDSPLVGLEEILLYLLKRWGRSSGWIPTPSSRTLMLIASLSSLTLIHTFLPVSEYLMAFDNRLSSIRPSSWGSLRK